MAPKVSESDGIEAYPMLSSPIPRAIVVGLEKAAALDAAPTAGDRLPRIREA
jgi:hypothetical protein